MYGLAYISPMIAQSLDNTKSESIFGLIGVFAICLITFIGIYKTACYVRDKK